MAEVLGSVWTSPSPTDGKGAVTPSSEPRAKVTTSPATCYTVRNGWAWAYIFVRHGTSHDRPSGDARHWVHVSVISDYGEFGYCWSHIGEDWRAFLSGLNFGYAMRKMLGARLDVPLDVDEAFEKAKAIVLRYRRGQSLDRKDARALFDAIEDSSGADDCRDFLRRWDDNSGGLFYRYELWDCRWDKPNPQAEGFWSEIWPHFCAALVAPEARATTHPNLSVEGVRDAGEASGQPTEPSNAKHPQGTP